LRTKLKTRPLIIAHRGASGYLPEHTIAGKALAFGMGADFLEQDVVASRDNELIVFHDLFLEGMTDVALKFPNRARDDGHFYCIDFDLAEIRTLSLHERVAPSTGEPVFPNRFPSSTWGFSIPTLDEELSFVEGLRQSTGRSIGVYPEIKSPDWHTNHGVDLGAAILKTLDQWGYPDRNKPLYVQCFDADELQRVRDSAGPDWPLIQLLDNQWSTNDLSLRDISEYAQGVGPSLTMICKGFDSGGNPLFSDFVDQAKAAGLQVHPYTFRADQLPEGIADFDSLLELFLDQQEVDGLFTDFPDRVARFLGRR
jgi:glycerophosphoryl diester phosphodiesterase